MHLAFHGNKYLLILLISACNFFFFRALQHEGSQFPEQELNPGPLH